MQAMIDRRCFYLKTDSGHVGPRHEVQMHDDFYLKRSLLGDQEGLQVESNLLGVMAGAGIATTDSWLWTTKAGVKTLASHVAGGTQLSDADPMERIASYASLAANLKRLHSIPAQGAGYIVATNPLRGAFDTWPEYLMSHFYEQATYATGHGLLSNEDAILIGYHCGAVRWNGEARLLHGDLSDRNLFAAKGEITAIIDWEDALAGPIEHDLAYWATFHPRDEWAALFDAYPYQPDRTFWAYYLRISLSKLVLNHKRGVPDLTRSLERIQMALGELA